MNLQQFSPYKVIKIHDEIAAYRNHEADLFYRYPMHVKIDLTEACNHQCSFCFYGEENRDIGVKRENISKGRQSIPINTLHSVIQELAAGGTRALTLIGGGEPLLHPQIKDVLRAVTNTPMQFGVVTNGGRSMDNELFELLGKASWLRFSIDTLDPQVYLNMHRPKNQNIDNLPHTLKNLKMILDRRNTGTTIGASFLLNPLNHAEILSFARGMKEMGVDYVEFKPMYLDSLGEEQKQFFLEIRPVLNEVQKLADSDFHVIVLMDRMSDSHFVTRDFTQCWVNYFTTHIGVDGRVYPCCVLAYAAGTEYGNLHEHTFSEIWLGERRRKIIDLLSADQCPRCWFDKTNEVIEHILRDSPHAYFV